jgi:hypothetical protein
MTVIDRSAIDALHRIEAERKAREDRMRNALEILASIVPEGALGVEKSLRFVRAVAREGLGREPLPRTED